jgi:uncharacterized membrane protein YdbT with pleckstrin-like domain
MSYVSDNLIKDETVRYEGHLHWMTFMSLRGLLSLFILPLVDYLSSEFAITNKRIIVKQGFISRRTMELNLNKVESVNVDQSILGRLLGYGSITVLGTGGTHEQFSNLSAPLEFRKRFQELSS